MLFSFVNNGGGPASTVVREFATIGGSGDGGKLILHLHHSSKRLHRVLTGLPLDFTLENETIDIVENGH